MVVPLYSGLIYGTLHIIFLHLFYTIDNPHINVAEVFLYIIPNISVNRSLVSIYIAEWKQFVLETFILLR